MKNFVIYYQHAGQQHELEFTCFPLNFKLNYQIVKSTLDLLPGGIRYTIETNYYPQLSLPRTTMEVDPQIRSHDQQVAYYSAYVSLLQHLWEMQIVKITCSIQSVEDYT